MGVGRALFEAARLRLPDGFWLATQPDNRRARAFYERLGMRLDRVEAGEAGDRVFYRFIPPGS